MSPLFAYPIPWLRAYLDDFAARAPAWRHLVFTDIADYLPLSTRNVTFLAMTASAFEVRIADALGVRMRIGPVPSPKFGDARPAFGLVFADYLVDADYWGHCDFDIVLGRVDAYTMNLRSYDLFSTERGAVNGVLSLYRNTAAVNTLFRTVPDWQAIFASTAYHAFDEHAFSRAAFDASRRLKTIRLLDWDVSEFDRMPDHRQPAGPQLGRHRNGALVNLRTGHEMMYFHFKLSKPAYPAVVDLD